MPKQPSEAVVDAWIALMRAQQTTLLKMSAPFAKRSCRHTPGIDVLWKFDRAGADGLRPFELERQMLIAQSNISRLIDRLVQQGYVERKPVEEVWPRSARGDHRRRARDAKADVAGLFTRHQRRHRAACLGT